MRMYIVLLGPPGVGKGTQAEILAETASLPHISSGDLFRENIKNETELGKLAQTYINKGELVPDDVTISMIRAEALDKLLAEFGGKVNHVPYITAAESVLVERLSGRWTCRENGHVFHEKFNPPKKAGVCDLDGSELYQRDDDKSETVLHRIAVYFKQTAPLIEYYRKCGLLTEVDGAQEIEKVTASLLAVIQKHDDA